MSGLHSTLPLHPDPLPLHPPLPIPPPLHLSPYYPPVPHRSTLPIPPPYPPTPPPDMNSSSHSTNSHHPLRSRSLGPQIMIFCSTRSQAFAGLGGPGGAPPPTAPSAPKAEDEPGEKGDTSGGGMSHTFSPKVIFAPSPLIFPYMSWLASLTHLLRIFCHGVYGSV